MITTLDVADRWRRPLLKPRRLAPGDRLAAVTPSWGGPGLFPHRYQAGKRQFEAEFGVELIEMPHTMRPPEWVAANPAARAEDLMQAFADPSIAGVVATIGGNDSIRLIRHLDLSVIRANPKVFLGFSDTTSLHFACLAAGVTSFYGPSIMAGFGENAGMHRFTVDGVRRALFQAEPIGLVGQNREGWTDELLDWSDSTLQTRPRRLHPPGMLRLLQGRGGATGRLIGGCAEVLEMIKATAWWPAPAYWDGAILFLETSEDVPAPGFVEYWLRNYAAQGILEKLAGILIARASPMGDESYQTRLEAAVVASLAQAGLPDLPVLSRLDFGHTQPMLTLPYGVEARIDCATASLTILEAGVC
ncbi:MAG TPA: S66 peptidase family protein [Aliidongia sp.]|nr:S66 peptidase family protein [Aliidongia sp.]